MNLAERNRQEVAKAPTQPVHGIHPDANYRLASQFRSTKPDVRAQIVSVADSLVPTVLSSVHEKLAGPQFAEQEPFTELWKKEDKHVMTAVHMLSIAGYETAYGPIINGKREITTNYPRLLHAVNDILEESEDSVRQSLVQDIHDERMRNWTASVIMDEVNYSIFAKLRDERDIERQNANQHAADVVKDDVFAA